MKKEYNIGDKIVIVDEIFGHNFDFGEVVTIVQRERNYTYKGSRGAMCTIYLAINKRNNLYWVWPSEIKDMSLSKLHLL